MQELGKNSKINFEIVHVRSYGYLSRKLREVAEEYGIVEYANEKDASRKCPTCGTHVGHERITRGLLKCHKHNKVFNADLVGAFNLLSKNKPISPSPALRGVGVKRPRPGAGLSPTRAGDVVPNLPAQEETLTLQGGEEVSRTD